MSDKRSRCADCGHFVTEGTGTYAGDTLCDACARKAQASEFRGCGCSRLTENDVHDLFADGSGAVGYHLGVWRKTGHISGCPHA